LKLSHLLPCGAYRASISAEEVEINGLSEHTDEMKEGDAFIARRGERFDPLHMLSKIEKSGVRAIILEEGHYLPSQSTVPCFFVKDIEETRASLWSKYFGEPQRDLTVIGITGTNGKTTTALILSHILNASGRKCGYIGTLGVFSGEKARANLKEGTLTTPSPKYLFGALRALKNEGCAYAVLEVSSHALAQKRVLPISFTVSAFTNLSEDHLDYHETMDAYFEAKALLFRQSAHALINIDDPYGRALYKRLFIKKSSLGILSNADHSLTDLNEKQGSGAQYTYQTREMSVPLKTNLLGSFNLYNSLTAVSLASMLGVHQSKIQEALQSLPVITGRMERLVFKEKAPPFSVIIDYAHTPDALEAAIRSARRFTRGRVLAVFGAGGDREKEKRAKMGAIAEQYADFSFVTTDNSRNEETLSIIRDILSGMPNEEKRKVISNRKNAIEEALSVARDGDTVLLLGKGHEEYMVTKEGTLPFSERSIVTAFLSERGYK